MIEKTFANVRTQLRRDTSTNWETNNPVLRAGELIIVTLTDEETRIKIGDGTSHYNDLPLLLDCITEEERAKLAGIEENANKYVLPTVSVTKGGTGYTTIVDTVYTTPRYRASSLNSAETTPTQNGVIAWTYE